MTTSLSRHYFYVISDMRTQKYTNCGSNYTKKNEHTHCEKQNYLCHICSLQFIKDGQVWFISDEKKEIIKNLLKERISLAGISRACNVSESWLYDYLDEVYEEIEDDLNATLYR